MMDLFGIVSRAQNHVIWPLPAHTTRAFIEGFRNPQNIWHAEAVKRSNDPRRRNVYHGGKFLECIQHMQKHGFFSGNQKSPLHLQGKLSVGLIGNDCGN